MCVHVCDVYVHVCDVFVHVQLVQMEARISLHKTMYTHHPLPVNTTPLHTLLERLHLESWSSGPAGENMVADLSSVQTLNIRLLYKVVEYAQVHKC